MKGFTQIAAVACVLVGIEARAQGPYKWSRNEEEAKWLPARATPELAFQPLIGLMAPAIQTPAPTLDVKKLVRRATSDNTCAYVNGASDASLYCGTDSACVYNSVRSNIGCCPDSSTTCPIWTTCYHSSQGSAYTTNNGLTLWCGSTAYPSCLKHVFYDTLFSGYTLWGCGRTAGSDSVYYKPTGVTAKSSSSRVSSKPSTTFDSSTTTSTTSSSSSPAPTPPPADSQPAAPVGAIAGGVVGGVAVLSLVGLAAFMLIRKNKKDSVAGSPPAGGPPSTYLAPSPQGPPGAPAVTSMYGAPPQMVQHQPGYPPQMAQQPGYPQQGFIPVDPRASIAKPPYSVTNSVYDPTNAAVSPPSSPPPQAYSPGAYPYPQHGAPSPTGQTSPTAAYATTPPPQGAPQHGFGYHSGPVPATYQQTHPGQPGFAAELPTQRPDRELRELA